MEQKRILILGGGFAGAYAARLLEKRIGHRADVRLSLVSHENFVFFRPMLDAVAGSDVGVPDILWFWTKMVRRTHVGIAEVEAIDLVKKQVRVRHPDLPNPQDITFDQLVLALGAVTNFYHTPGLEEHALT